MAGRALAGSLVLGPVGLVAGLVGGSKNQLVKFVAKFHDGRAIEATTDAATFRKLQSAAR